MLAFQSIVVLGFLLVFFTSAMIKAQFAMRKSSQKARERRLVSGRLASEHARPTQ